MNLWGSQCFRGVGHFIIFNYLWIRANHYTRTLTGTFICSQGGSVQCVLHGTLANSAKYLFIYFYYAQQKAATCKSVAAALLKFRL